MIHIRKEGEYINQGLNFYPLSDKYNFGFILRIRNFVWLFRYNKTLRKVVSYTTKIVTL